MGKQPEDEPIQVLMHPVLIPAFRDWLALRNLELRLVGTIGKDDLPTWIITPTDEALQQALQRFSSTPTEGR